MPSKDSNNLTKLKEEQHPRSFQNPLNVDPATDHTIHQSTNSDHAKDVIEYITAEKNVKRNIGRRREMDTRRCATRIKVNKKKQYLKRSIVLDIYTSLFAHLYSVEA